MLSVSQLVSSNIESDDRNDPDNTNNPNNLNDWNDLNDQNYLNDLNDLIDPKDLDDWMTESFADDWPYGIYVLYITSYC